MTPRRARVGSPGEQSEDTSAGAADRWVGLVPGRSWLPTGGRKPPRRHVSGGGPGAGLDPPQPPPRPLVPVRAEYRGTGLLGTALPDGKRADRTERSRGPGRRGCCLGPPRSSGELEQGASLRPRKPSPQDLERMGARDRGYRIAMGSSRRDGPRGVLGAPSPTDTGDATPRRQVTAGASGPRRPRGPRSPPGRVLPSCCRVSLNQNSRNRWPVAGPSSAAAAWVPGIKRFTR